MAEYLSPGVYVEEYDSSPRSIEGVGTSTAGFIGMAVKGPVMGAPVLVTSFSSFQIQFGGFLSEYTHEAYRYLAYSVEQFFANGGTRCYVMRVVPTDASAARAKSGILSLKAKNEGKWGNSITVDIKYSGKKKIQLIQKLDDLVYRAKVVNGFREGDYVQLGDEVNKIQSVSDNVITFWQPFEADPVDESLIPEKVLKSMELDVIIRYEDTAERFTEVTLNKISPNYLETRLKNSELAEVTVEDTEEQTLAGPMEAIFGAGAFKGIIEFQGGSDGSMSKVTAGTFIGEDMGPGKRTGIQAFLENNVVSMMAVPGITMPEVMVSLISHCENMKNRFAVLDMPAGYRKTNDLIEYRSMIDSTYAAMYHPWIQVYDRCLQRPSYIPPSGAVLGVYSRTDVTRGVHKAPANETVSCTGLSVNYTTQEQDILNPEGINLIRAIPGQGIRIWGARTASSNSAFKYVNIRRLFIYVEESIKNNTNWVVFEPNDNSLWIRVKMTITAFLETMWRNGMLSGTTPEEAFFVDIGTTTMTQDDIRSGRLICNIGIAPSRPAEFVIIRVTQHTSEADQSA